MYESGIEPVPAFPISPVKLIGTSSSSINVTIAMNKQSLDFSHFDIVYQTSAVAPINIVDVQIFCHYNGTTWSTDQYASTISNGSGYLNYKPSMVQMPDNNIRACWIRDYYGGGPATPYYVNVVYWNSASPSVFTYSGNMVNSVSINVLNDNSNTYYAYAQNTNNSNWQNFARLGSNTITLSTTGRHIQLSNGSSSANLCASAYYPVSLPYYFLNSSLGSLPKSSVEENTYGRGVQLVKDNIVFSYSMKSLTADKSTVKFVEIPEIKDTSSDRRMVQPLTIDSLNTFLLSEPFTIQNGMILNFSEGGGFLITSDGDSSVARQLMKNYQINCKIELIEDGTNKSIGIVKQSQFTSKDENNSNIFSSNLALNRSDVKNVRLKITLTTNITDVEGMLVNEYNTVNENILSKLSAENLTLQEKGIVTTYAIEQNYPNPFNPTTTINYQIKEDGLVTLKLYDILGEEITTLVNEAKTTGRYTHSFNGSDLPSGVYIYQLKVNDFVSSKKLMLLK